MVQCEIKLENHNRGLQYAGQMLRGSVEVHLDEPTKFRALSVDIFGEAWCCWEEEAEFLLLRSDKSRESIRNHASESNITKYSGRNVIFNSRIFLLGFEGSQAVQVPSGMYSYDFEIQLPDSLPASITTTNGYIRYNIEAVLELPPLLDKKFKLQFNVARNDDLNNLPELMLPCHSEEVNRYCSIFCRYEALALTVRLPQTGFAPGHSVPVTISYFNKSGVEVDKTKISMKQIIRYASNVPYPKSKLQVSTVAEMEADGIKGTGSVTLDKLLLLPQTMFTSNKRFCNVIQVSYELIVEAEVSGCRGGIEIRIPITVGLEHFEADARTFSVNNGISSVINSTPVATSHGLPPYPIYKSLHPLVETRWS